MILATKQWFINILFVISLAWLSVKYYSYVKWTKKYDNVYLYVLDKKLGINMSDKNQIRYAVLDTDENKIIIVNDKDTVLDWAYNHNGKVVGNGGEACYQAIMVNYDIKVGDEVFDNYQNVYRNT